MFREHFALHFHKSELTLKDIFPLDWIFFYKTALFIAGFLCFNFSYYNIIDSSKMHIINVIIDSWRVFNPRNFPMGKRSQVNSLVQQDNFY